MKTFFLTSTLFLNNNSYVDHTTQNCEEIARINRYGPEHVKIQLITTDKGMFLIDFRLFKERAERLEEGIEAQDFPTVKGVRIPALSIGDICDALIKIQNIIEMRQADDKFHEEARQPEGSEKPKESDRQASGVTS